jgi:predicted aldo/keto reductase-like oxidoreductase
MERRTFLKAMGTVAGCYAMGADLLSKVRAADQAEAPRGLPQRVLGRTGEKVSVIGFPGLALANYDQDQGTAGLHKAFDQGINYFDVAPAYGKDGDAEIKMGIGLQGIDRSRIFLACKTKMRDRDGARLELERSLKRLKTDYFDLYQMHAIFTEDEVTQALGPGGAIETFQAAKEEGKIRYFGFSAHTTAAALAALNGFAFDSVMFPISFVDYLKTGFGRETIKLANEKGTAVVAIKAMSKGAWPQGVERPRRWWYRTTEDQREVDLAVRFTLSQPSVVAAIPPSWLDLLDKAIAVGRSLHPITEAETLELREMAKDCQPLFRQDEQRVAVGPRTDYIAHSGCPHAAPDVTCVG